MGRQSIEPLDDGPKIIELAGGAHFDFPFCSHLQLLASGCQVAASDCYVCPENIMISPHAVLKKTNISAMLFCEEIIIIQDFSENRF